MGCRDPTSGKTFTKDCSAFACCVAKGNPIMETYPEQCRDSTSGKTFTKDCSDFACCVAKGNPITESYPEQCRDPTSSKTFTKHYDSLDSGAPSMTARKIFLLAL